MKMFWRIIGIFTLLIVVHAFSFIWPNMIGKKAAISYPVLDHDGIDNNSQNEPDITAEHLLKYYNKSMTRCCIGNTILFICGTDHTSTYSAKMVEDAFRVIEPGIVFVELCPSRMESLSLPTNVSTCSLYDILAAVNNHKMISWLVLDLLHWMQVQMASRANQKVGEEFKITLEKAKLAGKQVVPIDREYGVTVQRALVRVNMREKVSFACLVCWNVLCTLSAGAIGVHTTDTLISYHAVKEEIRLFSKLFPGLFDVVIRERDAYMAEVVCSVLKGLKGNMLSDIRVCGNMCVQGGEGCVCENVGITPVQSPDVDVGVGSWPPPSESEGGWKPKYMPRKYVGLVVVGAAHVPGLMKHLQGS